MTSQPAMGAIVAALEHEGRGTGVRPPQLHTLTPTPTPTPTPNPNPEPQPLTPTPNPNPEPQPLTPTPTQVSLAELFKLIEYWESVRFSYAAFESGQKSGSAEVYEHEMPGGQYTNLQFQSTSLGLSDQWAQVKTAHAAPQPHC